MELTHRRLKAALISGKIPVNDETVATFDAGLSAIGRGYDIEKVVSKRPKTTDLTRNLLQLHKAFCRIIEVSDADQNDSRQIELMLLDLRHGHQVLGFVEDLRPLCIHLELVLAVFAQNTVRRERRQNPETWFLLAVHDLFATITGNPEPGIAGPLHRFTKRCAVLIDSRIRVPESENSFQKRLTAALARRTGKISVMPRAVFRENCDSDTVQFLRPIYRTEPSPLLDIPALRATFPSRTRDGSRSGAQHRADRAVGRQQFAPH